MGFLITGSDTRTPAHYHAVITAVSVSSAGMLLTFGLKELGRAPAPPRATRILIGLYGGGQFVASIAMFVAGGYGALRKTPSGAGSLDAVAATGMAVHGDRLDLHDHRRRGLRRDRHSGAHARRRGSIGRRDARSARREHETDAARTATPLQRASPTGSRSWETGEGRPSLMSASSSTTPIPPSRRSGNGRRPPRPEPPSGRMTASSAPGNPTRRS